LTHCWNRLWQVWYGGNLSGKSDHLAPERNIQSTPFKTSRALRGGLPRVWTTSALSNNGSIKDHCSSVNSSRRAICEVYQTIFEMASITFGSGSESEHGSKFTNACARRFAAKPTGTSIEAAGCLDSQSVKTTSVPGERGFDNGKKVNRRNRHILVDTLGLLLVVVVHAANISESAGARLVLAQMRGSCKKLRRI